MRPRSLQGLGSSKAQQRPLHHSELARYARLIKGSKSKSKSKSMIQVPVGRRPTLIRLLQCTQGCLLPGAIPVTFHR